MNSGFIDIDIHGCTKRGAKQHIDACLRKADSGVYRVRIIHGCHGGTELRDMVRSEYRRHPRVIRIATGLNPGETFLVLKEL